MKVENQVHPSPENVKGFVAVEGPVAMVNLLKFKDRAEYKDGRETELSGREAYGLYATEMKKLVEGSGGRFIFSGQVKNLLLGKVDELWDSVGIVEYPTSKELIRISASPEFQLIEAHREAGLAGQLNITCQEGML
jgi:uncharacterized protein (DUF1330 family)